MRPSSSGPPPAAPDARLGGRCEEGPHGTTAAAAAGLSRRGDTYVYDWRDASGHKFRRKAGNTIDEAIAFKTRIDAELNAGVFVPGSRITFAEYAAHWIETHPLKGQTRLCEHHR